MTGFDSTWYHGPFAAGFAQSGDTWNLHFIAPQFLAWLYPANSELLHAVGMNAFGRDLLSPLLNLGWFLGCLLACWCIGRPYRVAPWSLALGATALSLPALADQAGEARNDIVGIFFLLAAVAVALNAWAGESAADEDGGGRPGAISSLPVGALVVVGLAAGLAAGTKLNFLLPAAVLVIGLVAVAARGRRLEALAAGGLAALAGGGYWYLRNLAHTGNPLPWFDGIGPISLPAPEQALGGREAHSVLGYLSDGTVWSEWFLPGLQHGLGNLWLLLLLASVAGLTLALLSGWRERVPAVAGLAGLAAAAAWLVAPTSASGPEGMPRGFESGLRYLAPALVLGLALLPTAPILRDRLRHWGKRRLVRRARRPNAAVPGGLSAGGGARHRGRLRRPAPLPARPLREPDLRDAGVERRLPLGDAALRGADRDHQHPPVPALRHRPLQPGRVRRRRAAPRRLRRSLELPRLAPPPRPGRLRLRRRQPRPGRTGQAALPADRRAGPKAPAPP